MTLASDGKGNFVTLGEDGQWKPTPTAEGEGGRKMVLDNGKWVPVPGSEAEATPADAQPPTPGFEGNIVVPGAATATGFGRGVGLGTRDVIEGTAAPAGMVLDAATWVPRVIQRAAGVPTHAPTTLLSQGLTAIGLPEPETDTERLSSGIIRGASGALAGSAAGLLPGMTANAPYLANLLTTAVPTQVAAGAASGGAGEATRQAGYGPLAQQAAGLLAGLGTAGVAQLIKGGWNGVNALLAPFRQAGQEEIARNALLQSSSAPKTLLPRLEEGVENPRLPGAPVTTAQQARDPGLLVVESGQRSETSGAPGSIAPGTRFRDVDARRNVVRDTALTEMGDASDPGSRGVEVRGALTEGKKTMATRVGQLFTAAEPEGGGAYPIDNIKQAAAAATAKFSKERMGGGVPEELQAVIDDIAGAKGGVMDFEQIQNVRSRLGEIAGEAASKGKTSLAGAARSIQKALEDEAQSPAWQEAIKARAEMGAALDRSTTGASATGQILNRDTFGRPIMPDENVANRAISSVGNLRQTLGAVDKAIADGRAAGLPAERIAELEAHAAATREALRGQFVANLTKTTETTGQIADAAGNVSTQLSAHQFAKFLKDNRAIASELFDSRQLANLDLIAADFAETSMAQATAKVAGSPTVQNLSVANMISRVTSGIISPNSPVAQTFFGVGPVMKMLYANPEAAIRQMLTEAMVNPQFAQALLTKGSPEAMRRALGYVEKTMGERLRAATAEATARTGVRQGESDATRPAAPLDFPRGPPNRLAVPRYDYTVAPSP